MSITSDLQCRLFFVSGWLRPLAGDGYMAYRKIWKTQLGAKRKDLPHHMESNKHKKNSKQTRSQSIITTYVSETSPAKICELRVAAFVATKMSISGVDDLCRLISSLDKTAQTLPKIKMHRTKCSSLILNVLSPNMRKELIEDVGQQKYSLIIDESTDVSDQNCLALMIKFFPPKFAEL